MNRNHLSVPLHLSEHDMTVLTAETKAMLRIKDAGKPGGKKIDVNDAYLLKQCTQNKLNNALSNKLFKITRNSRRVAPFFLGF